MANNNYKNVILVGASGNLGKNILAEFLADPFFNVTVLTRNNSSAIFPSNVKVIKIDYSDKNAVTNALIGQDVVISTVGIGGVFDNFGNTLVEAALEAGVKWVIPDEFTLDTTHPLATKLPIYASKIAIAELLKKHQSRIAHTLISTGGFLDWGFDNGFLGFDITNRTATLYDEGKNLFSGTTVPHIGKAVVAIIRHPELTLNKRIFIADVSFTQQQALALFEKYTGTKWTVNHVSTNDALKNAEEYLKKGDVKNGSKTFIMAIVHNGEGACYFEGKTSNKALGLETYPLDQIVKEAVERNQAAH
jgi:uncharacterized protein YbjT (DUF2867 family)